MIIGHVVSVMYSRNAPLSILPAKNFNMSPILQTLKTSGSCFWCQEMNFISIFDSFRAFVSTPLLNDPGYIPDPLSLYAKHFEAITLLKHWKHFKLSMETSTLWKTEREKKKRKINCQLLKIILIMLILFLLCAKRFMPQCADNFTYFQLFLYTECIRFIFFYLQIKRSQSCGLLRLLFYS